MEVVTPVELKSFMDAKEISVIDVSAETGLHTNTVYRFLSGEHVNRSTVRTLMTWKRLRESGHPQMATMVAAVS